MAFLQTGLIWETPHPSGSLLTVGLSPACTWPTCPATAPRAVITAACPVCPGT